jgi:hypothetical protein
MMTLEEIDAALAALPASPVTRDQILERAALMRRRIELVDVARRPEAMPPVPHEIAVVTPAGISCILTAADKVLYAEFIDGRPAIKMGWPDFSRLVRSPNGGHLWANANPGLLQQLQTLKFSF